jgi:hypothetical protein
MGNVSNILLNLSLLNISRLARANVERVELDNGLGDHFLLFLHINEFSGRQGAEVTLPRAKKFAINRNRTQEQNNTR